MPTLLYATSVQVGLQKIDNSCIIVFFLLLAFPLTLPILEVYRFSAANVSFDNIYAKLNIWANFTVMFKGPLAICKINPSLQTHPLHLVRYCDIK